MKGWMTRWLCLRAELDRKVSEDNKLKEVKRAQREIEKRQIKDDFDQYNKVLSLTANPLTVSQQRIKNQRDQTNLLRYYKQNHSDVMQRKRKAMRDSEKRKQAEY